MYRRFRNDNRVFEAGTKKTKKGEAGVLKDTNTNSLSTKAGDFWETNTWFCQWN